MRDIQKIDGHYEVGTGQRPNPCKDDDDDDDDDDSALVCLILINLDVFLLTTRDTGNYLTILRMQNVRTWCVQVLRSPKVAFAAAMQFWRERCEKCVFLQGDYVEK